MKWLQSAAGGGLTGIFAGQTISQSSAIVSSYSFVSIHSHSLSLSLSLSLSFPFFRSSRQSLSFLAFPPYCLSTSLLLHLPSFPSRIPILSHSLFFSFHSHLVFYIYHNTNPDNRNNAKCPHNAHIDTKFFKLIRHGNPLYLHTCACKFFLTHVHANIFTHMCLDQLVAGGGGGCGF